MTLTAPTPTEAVPDIPLTARTRRRLLDVLLALRDERDALLARHARDSRALDLEPGAPAPVVTLLERRIAQLEDALARAVVVGEIHRASGVALLGSHVEVRWEDGGCERYEIATPADVGRSSGSAKVSCDSPLGRALIGRGAGERAAVDAPAGQVHLTIERVDPPW